MFHQREMVRMGEAEEVLAWRETWMERAKKIFEQAAWMPRWRWRLTRSSGGAGSSWQ